MVNTVVIDTNVFVSALLKAETAPRQIVRLCLSEELKPLMGNALLAEFEELMQRDKLFKKGPLTAQERQAVLNAFLSRCDWVSVYFLWRPNLRDEADNHLLELAIAGGASHIITGNTKDFRGAALRFSQIEIVTPSQFLTHVRGN